MDYFQPYVSNGALIKQSSSHPGMFIFEYPNGGFCTINSTATLIQETHKRDKNQDFQRHYKI